MRCFKTVRADLDIFNLVHTERGILKYFYYPDFRTVLLYRISSECYRYRILRPLAYFITVLNDFIAGVWIGPSVEIGPGLFLGHARGLVINPGTKIGKYCSIIQRVTIGGPNVVIGDYVEINSSVSIISNPRGTCHLTIGNNVIIGAGAVVVDDVQDNCVVVGVPGRVIKSITSQDNWVEFRKRRNREGF